MARFFFSSHEGSYSPKQSFVAKVWIFTKNKLRHNLQLKTDSLKNFIADIFDKVPKLYLKKTELHFTFPMKLLVDTWSFTKSDCDIDSVAAIFSKAFMFSNGLKLY